VGQSSPRRDSSPCPLPFDGSHHCWAPAQMDRACHPHAGKPTPATCAICWIKRGLKIFWRTVQTFQELFEGNTYEECYSPCQLETLAADRKGWGDICTTGLLSTQAPQDKNEEERRRRRHELAARNRVSNAADLCPTCGRTCLARTGLHSHKQSHLPR